MPLSVAKVPLEAAILKAFEKMRAGEDNKTLAKDLSAAIHTYATAASVDITAVTSIVPPGVAVVAPPPSGVGATAAPGTAAHVAGTFGKLI